MAELNHEVVLADYLRHRIGELIFVLIEGGLA
jgi:hypothetical protein